MTSLELPNFVRWPLQLSTQEALPVIFYFSHHTSFPDLQFSKPPSSSATEQGEHIVIQSFPEENKEGKKGIQKVHLVASNGT